MTETDFLAVDYHVAGNRSAVDVQLGRSPLVGVSVAVGGASCHYFTEDLANVVRSFGTQRRVYHDAVFSRAVELKYGLPLVSEFDCVRTMGYLADEKRPHDFSEVIRDLNPRLSAGLAEVHVHGRPPAPSPMPINSALVPWLAVTEFNFFGQLVAQCVENVYRQIELPLVDPLAALSQTPIRVDVERLMATLESHQVQLDIKCYQVEQIAGRHVDLTADRDLRTFLYEQLRLPVVAETTTGAPSLAREVLQALMEYHPAVRLIIDARHLQHVVRAARSLLEATDVEHGCVHPQLDPLGAVTGRLSCQAPNLQALSAILRTSIVADRRHQEQVLVELDYMQMELRVLAFLSQDCVLCKAFAAEQDVHRLTAARLFGIRPEQATDQQRSVAKTVNFGIVFGQTPQGLAQKLQVSVEQAAEFIAGFYRCYPGVSDFVGRIRDFASVSGFVPTYFGRRRRLPEARSRAHRERSLRQAVNFVIQGTAADLNKLAFARLWRHLPPGGRLLLNVHDSFLLELPQDRLGCSIGELKYHLELLPMGWTVPLKVSTGTGHTWADCKPGEAVSSLA